MEKKKRRPARGGAVGTPKKTYAGQVSNTNLPPPSTPPTTQPLSATVAADAAKDKARRKAVRKRIDKFSTAIMRIGQCASFLDNMDLPCLDDPEVAQEAVDDLKTVRRQLRKVILRIQDINHLGGTP